MCRADSIPLGTRARSGSWRQSTLAPNKGHWASSASARSLEGKAGCFVLFYLVCRIIYKIYQVCSDSPAKPSEIPTMPPVAAQSQALCRFPLCRVRMPEGDWPKQLCKLGAGLPFPVRCDEDLWRGVLGDSKRCFQHFRVLPSARHFAYSIPGPGCREPASGNPCQNASNGSKHITGLSRSRWE